MDNLYKMRVMASAIARLCKAIPCVLNLTNSVPGKSRYIMPHMVKNGFHFVINPSEEFLKVLNDYSVCFTEKGFYYDSALTEKELCFDVTLECLLNFVADNTIYHYLNVTE